MEDLDDISVAISSGGSDQDIIDSSSGLENTKIQSVQIKTNCSRTMAINALLSNEEDVSRAVSFLNGSLEVYCSYGNGYENKNRLCSFSHC